MTLTLLIAGGHIRTRQQARCRHDPDLRRDRCGPQIFKVVPDTHERTLILIS